VNILKVYLVEDSAVIRASLIAALEELAPIIVCATAEDEQSAVLWMADTSHQCDLAIIDIQLRQGSGLGVISAAQKLPSRPKLAVLSNYATTDIRRKCLALGANRVFDKSNDLDALIDYCNVLASGEPTDSDRATLT
jgi:DNA-binding NarL/FixJ family response regulator